MKNKIILKLTYIFVAIAIIAVTDFKDSKINKAVNSSANIVAENIKTNKIVVSKDNQERINETILMTENGEDIATQEIIESNKEEELCITDEGALENDAVKAQENISYDGNNTGDGLTLLGEYQGLTYYSQADSRWANEMFSITGNTEQTIKSSGCGPTAASIIVSSSKGAILPPTMANLFVDNGYRTRDNGTAWDAFPFIADYFSFREYYTTNSFNTAMTYLEQKNNEGNSKYFIIASCGSGLFTYNGHYIVLFSLDGETMQIYDPFLYENKFETASRKLAEVKTSGNTIYITKSKFEEFSNYKNFWIFSNDSECLISEKDNKGDVSLNYSRYVSTKESNLNVRNNPNGNKIGSLIKGTKVTVCSVDGEWSQITSPIQGWVSNYYLSSSYVFPNNKLNNTNYTIGKYKVKASLLRVRSGPSKNYKFKKFSQLTQNAKKQNRELGNHYADGYFKGVVCNVTKVSGNWGKTPSGWICLDYCTKIT